MPSFGASAGHMTGSSPPTNMIAAGVNSMYIDPSSGSATYNSTLNQATNAIVVNDDAGNINLSVMSYIPSTPLASQNTLFVRGQFPAVMTAGVDSYIFHVRGAGQGSSTIAGQSVARFHFVNTTDAPYNSNYSGSQATAAVNAQNGANGTGVNPISGANSQVQTGDFAILGYTTNSGATAGWNIGGSFRSDGSSAWNIGALGIAISTRNTPTANIGALAIANGGTSSIGTWSGFGTTEPTITGLSGAYVADTSVTTNVAFLGAVAGAAFLQIDPGAAATALPSGSGTAATAANLRTMAGNASTVNGSNGGAAGNLTTTLGAGGAATATGNTSQAGGAAASFTVTGSAGGAATTSVGSGTYTGGVGSSISFTAGAGGASQAATSGTNVGGLGGSISGTAGAGGLATNSSGTNAGGGAGTVTWTGGQGGSNHAGGAVTLVGGQGATSGANGSGGPVTLTGGQPGGNATTVPGIVQIVQSWQLSQATPDSYLAGLRLTPTYTTGAFTVTRHNYIDINNVTVGSATVTDAAVMRFDAAAGTHKAVDSGTTKTSPGTVTAWLKVNLNGTIEYIPIYSSKTT